MEKNNELIKKLNSYFLSNKFDIKKVFLPGGDVDRHTMDLSIDGKLYQQFKPIITMYNDYHPITIVDEQINNVIKLIGQQCDCLNLHRELFPEKSRCTFTDLTSDSKLTRERKTYLGNHINNNESFYFVFINIDDIQGKLDVIIESEFLKFVFDLGNDFTDHDMLRRVKLKDYNK